MPSDRDFISQGIYARLRAIDAANADPDTRFLLTRAIAQYDRAGVGSNEATRTRIRALQDRITQNSIAFERNIANGRVEVTATAAELDGLPADYVAAHRPGPDGRIGSAPIVPTCPVNVLCDQRRRGASVERANPDPALIRPMTSCCGRSSPTGKRRSPACSAGPISRP